MFALFVAASAVCALFGALDLLMALIERVTR